MERLAEHILSCRRTVEMHKSAIADVPTIPINCILTEEEAKRYPSASKDRHVYISYRMLLPLSFYYREIVKQFLAKPSAKEFFTPSYVSKYEGSEYEEYMLHVPKNAYKYIIMGLDL